MSALTFTNYLDLSWPGLSGPSSRRVSTRRMSLCHLDGPQLRAMTKED
ncbi:MAG: hypothetical protein KGJ49_08965 [Alphaproteobacteria bacterium]|nr:hypothetical protein [Alphaproteobacteria bacterium]